MHLTTTFLPGAGMFDKDTVDKFSGLRTPFYYYDMEILDKTIDIIKNESGRYGYKIHYALKANANEKILRRISSAGFGADCVSGNEILMAIKCGFKPGEIVFAGVGKTDDEILTGIKNDIFSYNVESLEEIGVINKLAEENNYTARISIRINPNVNAFTHDYITTGIEEAKFGINMWELEEVVEKIHASGNIELIGLHFHIGSQIRLMSAFRSLCTRINELQDWFEGHNIEIKHINAGGGLAIDYKNPERITDFGEYFSIFNEHLKLHKGQVLHFEPGRSVTGQAGSLITRVLYTKDGSKTRFAIVDAGMTDLIRPALYQAYHKIENITSSEAMEKYNVVGPICESSDSFAKYIDLPRTRRDDLLAIRSAGAYGEVMTSNYNLREKAPSVFSDEL